MQYLNKKEENIDVIDVIDLINNEQLNEINDKKITIRKRPKGPEITLPRYVYLDSDLAWSIGFFIAEGNKVYSGIGISNREIELIIKFKECIEKSFGIQNEKWRLYVKTPNKDLKKVRERWIRKLKISHTVANFVSNARQDILEIRINNTLFSIIFNALVNGALSKIIEDRVLLTNFLDGYEVGDGSVLQRKGYLYGICITVKDPFMKDFLVTAFKRLYNYQAPIRRTKGSYEILVRGIHMMTKIILDRHFESSKRQWRKLIRCYLRKQYTRSHIRYWRTITNNPMPINKIAKQTKRSHWSVRDALNIDTELGLVDRKRVQVRDMMAPYFNFYCMSNRGQELIKVLENNI